MPIPIYNTYILCEYNDFLGFVLNIIVPFETQKILTKENRDLRKLKKKGLNLKYAKF